MKIKAEMLPDNLFTDDRQKKLLDLEHQVDVFRSRKVDAQLTIRRYQERMAEAIMIGKATKQNIKDLKNEIQKTPMSEERIRFYADQVRRINDLPLTKFDVSNIQFLGTTYRVIKMLTKPLTLVGSDATERSRYVSTKEGRKIGKYFIIITQPIGSGSEPQTMAMCLDNNSVHSLPCINGAHCCLGNISGLVRQRMSENKVGNIAELMIDFLTASTYGNPYIDPDNCWSYRRQADKSLSVPELIARLRSDWREEFVLQIAPSILEFIGDKLVKVTAEQQNARSNGQGNWIYNTMDRHGFIPYLLPSTTPPPANASDTPQPVEVLPSDGVIPSFDTAFFEVTTSGTI